MRRHGRSRNFGVVSGISREKFVDWTVDNQVLHPVVYSLEFVTSESVHLVSTESSRLPMLMSYVATAPVLSCRFSLGNAARIGLSALTGGTGGNTGNSVGYSVSLRWHQSAIAGAKQSFNRLHTSPVLGLGGLIPTLSMNRPSWISDRRIADRINEPLQRLSGTFRNTPGRT
jgi:hypothetical protein